MASYKIELKTSNRDCKCRGSCKGNIVDGHVRVAAISDPSEGHSNTYWRHLACMTEKVRSNIAETYPDLADMPGFEEPGIREAWLCAAAHGNMAQVKAAFDAQHFDLDGFVPQSLEEVAAAAPKAKKVPAEKAKKPAAKKAAKASADDKSEPKKRGRPKKIVTESKPLPKKAKAAKPKKAMGSLGSDPYGVVRKPAPPISDGGRRSGRNGTPGPAADDIDTDAYFVSPSSLPA